MIIDDNQIFEAWTDLLHKDKLSDRARAIADKFPSERSLVIPYIDIYRMNPELAEIIINEPEKVLNIGESAIRALLEMDQKATINLRVSDLLPGQQRRIRDIVAEDVLHLIQLEGNMNRAQEIRARLLTATFSCSSCNFRMEVEQDYFTFTEPLECCKDDGGCGKRAGSTTFRFIPQDSLFIDNQRIEVQESHEDLRAGQQPRSIECEIADDICDQAYPGEVVRVVGIVKLRQVKTGKDRTTIFKHVIQVINIQALDVEEEVHIDGPRAEELTAIAKDGGFEKVKKSIIPTLLVKDVLREGFTCILFGGVGKELEDGSWSRGDLNALLVGDPGTAKTKGLRYMSRVLPRGQYASGKDTSGPGLTASALKDEFGEGKYTLVAGRIPLADKSICCLDEISLLDKDEIDRVREPMEDQTCTISKGGINAKLNARCAIILGDNPRYGAFREGTPPVSQISDKIPEAILSRSDLIFFLKDEPTEENDRNIFNHVLLHKHAIDEIPKPPLDIRDIRELVMFCRAYDPVWSIEVINYGAQKYAELRGLSVSGLGERTRTITGRQIPTIDNMATSYARAGLRAVEKKDIDRAFRFFEDSTKLITGGDIDMDAITSRMTAGTRKKATEMEQVVKEIAGEEGMVRKEWVKDKYCDMSDIDFDRAFEQVADRILYKPKTSEEVYYLVGLKHPHDQAQAKRSRERAPEDIHSFEPKEER